ncbi:MAG: class I SAM-dependent methyltransferase [Oscillospiraceae bacterium]|nr:class I SAM-dependent methyltransferase [Oscillospiraceae bacterium]
MIKEDIRAFFDALAPTWDDALVRNEPVIEKILDNARISDGQKILDVACGTGVLVGDYLTRGAAQVTGIDLSPNMIEQAQKKFCDARVRLVCGDVETAGFGAEFDCVMVYNAFPHFPDPKRLIDVLCGYLKTGGVLSIAHGMSREQLERHHAGHARNVSLGLMEAEQLQKLLEPAFEVTTCISDDTMYQVAGVKR